MADGRDGAWRVDVDPGGTGPELSRARLGLYDLSGALFDYASVPGLRATAQEAGIAGADWRVGLGRWEAGTQLLPRLSDGTPCPLGPPGAAAPPGAGDLELIAARDWFTDDGDPVTLSDTADGSRYALAYARSALDQALALGATPFLSVDSMPRALAVNRTPERRDCLWSFRNRVSNARPADPAVFAAALVGALERLRLGSGGEPGRPFTHVELWNEPELPHFWDPSFEDRDGPLDRFFEMATTTLAALDAWRAASPHPEIRALRFGLAGFAAAESATRTLAALARARLPNGARPPLDFISFHAYADDPWQILRDVFQVRRGTRKLWRGFDVEVVLSEWGPDLDAHASDPAYAASMEPALHAATVLAQGAMDRAHRAILWDFYAGDAITLGLADHAGRPKPLQRAYALLARVLGEGASWAPYSPPLPNADASLLVTRDAGGKLRALVVNRSERAHDLVLTIGGERRRPSAVFVFDDPTAGITNARPGQTLALPPRSIVVAEY